MTGGCCATTSSTVGTGTTSCARTLADDTFRAGVAAADLNGANMFIGEAVGLIHEVLPAATIPRRMDVEAANALGVREHGARDSRSRPQSSDRRSPERLCQWWFDCHGESMTNEVRARRLGP